MSKNRVNADWSAPQDIVAGTTLRGSAYELPKKPQWLNQVHGSRVVHWGSADFNDGPPDADAIISDQPDSICVVRTADCVPILLCARNGREIAAIHAGWRGLADHIIDATLNAMNTPEADVVAWIGPAISQSAFEIGPEVREAFGKWGERDAMFRRNERGRYQADLFGLARAMLQARGVEPFGEARCTFADADRYYSYRRDGSTGRLLSFVYRP